MKDFGSPDIQRSQARTLCLFGRVEQISIVEHSGFPEIRCALSGVCRGSSQPLKINRVPGLPVAVI